MPRTNPSSARVLTAVHSSRSILTHGVTSAGGWNRASTSMTGAPSLGVVGKSNRRRISRNVGRLVPGTRSAQEIRARRGRRSVSTRKSRGTGHSATDVAEDDAYRIVGHRDLIPLEGQFAGRGKVGRIRAEQGIAEAVRSPELLDVDRADALHSLDGFIDLAQVQHVLKSAVLEAHELLYRRFSGAPRLRLKDVRPHLELSHDRHR